MTAAATPGECQDCGRPLPPGHAGPVCVHCLWGGPEETVVTAGAAPPAPGAMSLRVPGHDVIAEIARGGMGIVYKAWERGPRREVALKMLRPQLGDDADMRARFRQEAQALAGLEHAAILPVYRVDENADLPFFTMKLAAGGTLASRRADYAGKWRETAALVARLAGAIHYAHSHGVLHRDIKPGNILFDEAGQAYLSDFGLVKILDCSETITLTRDFLGTPHYSAPEVAASNASAATVASDVWSLGIILYELLAGRLPFDGEGVPALLRAIVEDNMPPLPAAVPRDLAVVCGKCLTKSPGGRYASAAALAEDLECWLDGRPILASPAGVLERFWRWARRNPALAALWLALLTALGLLWITAMREAATDKRLLAESQAREAEAKAGAEAARAASQRALHAEVRARLDTGPWADRDKLLASLAETAASAPASDEAAALRLEARSLTASLRALPALVTEGTIAFDRGGWAPRLTGDLRRYVTLESGYCAVREHPSGEEVCRIDAVPLRSYPPGPLSSDGRRILITGATEGQVWSTTPPRLLHRLPRLNPWNTFSPDGRWLISGDAPRKRVIITDLEATPIVDRDVEGLPPGRWGVRVVSPDSQFAMIGSLDQEFGMQLVDIATAMPVRAYRLAAGTFVTRTRFSPDGSRLYATMADGRMACWETANPDPLWAVTAHIGSVDAAAPFAGGSLIMTQGRDARTKVWEAATGQLLALLPWAGRSIAVSTDGARLAIVLEDQKRLLLCRYEPSTFASSTVIPMVQATNTYLRGQPRVLPLPGSSQFAVTTGHNIHLVAAAKARLAATIPCGRIESLAFDAAHRQFLRGASGVLSRVPLDHSSSNVPPGAPAPPDPALRLAATGYGTAKASPHFAFAPTTRTVVLRSADGIHLRPLPGMSELEAPLPPLPGLPDKTAPENLAFSPDGRWLLWAGRAAGGRQVLLLPLVPPEPGAPVLKQRAHYYANRLHDAAFSAAGDAVLVIHERSFACVDALSGERRWLHPRQPGAHPGCFATAPGTRLIAVTLNPDHASLLDPADGRILLELRHPLGLAISALAFTDDGKRLAVLSSQQLTIWHLDQFECTAGR